MPGVITDGTLTNGAIAVGISNGHLRVDEDGNYNPWIQPKVVSFTDIMNGKSTNNADAIFEIYTLGVSAVGHKW